MESRKIKITIYGKNQLIEFLRVADLEEDIPAVEALADEYELEYLADYVKLLEYISEATDGQYTIYNHGTEIDIERMCRY
jgi:hypothetical protein